MRKREEGYPSFSAELDELNRVRGTAEYETAIPEVIAKIIKKHEPNALHTKGLYERYQTTEEAIPIAKRTPAYALKDPNVNRPNNKINHDYFSEIVDFFVGCFGKVKYSYSTTGESEEDTGGKASVDRAAKALSDFVARNTMADKDNETKKFASICGYVGRLVYSDPAGEERVAIIPPYECAVLSNYELTSPEYGIRYHSTKNYNDENITKVEFYDGEYCRYYEGDTKDKLVLVDFKETLFGGSCPLQIIPKNTEMLGDAENVLALIDAYDKAISDAGNDLESLASALLAIENIMLTEKDRVRLQNSGVVDYFSLGDKGAKIYYVTKDLSPEFLKNYTETLRGDIYRLSKTPNLSDGSFGAESGEARKFRIMGIEAKCTAFEGKLQLANTHMFSLLAAAWQAKRIPVDPLQCFIEVSRNMPTDYTTEAQAVKALIDSGLPPQVAYSILTFIDDLDYVMQLIDEMQGPKTRDLDNDDFYEEGTDE